MAGDIRMKEPRMQRTEQVNTAQQDHSANYLFLIIGTPLVAFLIAASAMLESRGFPVPLVRIGTGAAGLILQAIPFMLLDDVGRGQHVRQRRFSDPPHTEIVGRRTGRGIGGRSVPTGVRLHGGAYVRESDAQTPAAAVCGDVSVRDAGDEPDGDMVHMVRIHRQTMDGGGPHGVGHGSGDSRGGVVRGVAAPLPCGA